MKEKQITAIAPGTQYPPSSGGSIRTYSILGNLSDEYTFRLISHDVYIKKYRALTVFESSESIEIPGSISHFFGGILFKLTGAEIGGIPRYFFSPLSPHLKKKYVSSAKASNILFFESPWYISLLKKIPNIKDKIVVYDAHNVEHDLAKMNFKTKFFRKKLLSSIYKIEKKTCEKSDIILVVSQEEKERFSKLYSVDYSKIYLAPNGVDVTSFSPASHEEKANAKNKLDLKNKTLLFIGMKYGPNIEAGEYIINHLAPKLPEYTFVIAGRVCEKLNSTHNNVKLMGFVDDETKSLLFNAADAALNPISRGAGTNIKMLEYMAAGLPTFTTPLGARGLDLINNKHAMIYPLEEFAVKIRELLTNDATYLNIRENGRNLVEEKFSWNSISKNVAKIIKEKISTKTKD